MRIIVVTANFPYGRDEAFLIAEIRQFLDTGHDVLVVPRSPRGPLLHGQDLLRQARCETLYSRDVVRTAVSSVVAAPRKTAAAARLLKGGRSFPVRCKNLAVVPKALWLASLAESWQADHIHCHWAGTTATTCLLASAMSGIPWSLTAHRWDIVENNLLGAKLHHASFVRFISEDGQKMAAEAGARCAGRARVLHMGVPIPEKVMWRDHVRPVVLCPARLVEVKGHRVLLEAWREVQKADGRAELWLAGSGELQKTLEDQADGLGLRHTVRFLGPVPHADLLRLYQEGKISAVVLASLNLKNGLHEGIPVSLIEAMSYGIPVVATASGGVSELVAPGCGLLVPAGDGKTLASAMRRLLGDASLRMRLGEAGRRRAAEYYDVGRIAAELITEFEAAQASRRAF